MNKKSEKDERAVYVCMYHTIGETGIFPALLTDGRETRCCYLVLRMLRDGQEDMIDVKKSHPAFRDCYTT